MEKKSFPNDMLLPEVVKMLDEKHTVTIRLQGYSMRPFLEHKRDKAVLASVTMSELEVGDVILAEIRPGFFVLHRIVRIDGEAVTLCGDGNLQFEHCKLSDIKAKAVAFYRKDRTTADSIKSWKWKIYSWIWVKLFPIRRYLLYIYRKIFT